MALSARLLFLLALLAAVSGPACQARLLGSVERRLSEVTSLFFDIAIHHQKHQPSPPAPGLPRECLTYNERYGHHYHTGLAHRCIESFFGLISRDPQEGSLDNAQHRHSKYVVLLKLYRVFEDRWPLDLVLNVRAIAAEVTAVGYHFYILFQPPTTSHSPSLTREEVLDFLPFDLRPFVIVHDYDDDYKLYHALGAHDNSGADLYNTWGPGPRAPYVAIARFMRRYQAYEYAWVIEHDVRWTGGSWGELLNAALDLGRQASQQELNAQSRRMVDMSRTASRALPVSTDGLPDLLTFDGIDTGSNWGFLPNNMANSSILYSMGAQVYLGSRRLWEAAHEYSLKGVGSHIESALATMAKEQGLKMASIKIPHNDTFPAYYHCCAPDALQMYGAWYNDTASCAPSLLVHPIKNKEAFWPGFTHA